MPRSTKHTQSDVATNKAGRARAMESLKSLARALARAAAHQRSLEKPGNPRGLAPVQHPSWKQRTMAAHHPERLDDVRRVAEYLRVSIPTVYRLLRSQKLQAQKVGGQWRISREAVRQFLEDQINVRR